MQNTETHSEKKFCQTEKISNLVDCGAINDYNASSPPPPPKGKINSK